MTLTESEVMEKTGYSRKWLNTLRRGGTQTQGGKEYATKPVLVTGVDYTEERHGRTVIVKYAESVVAKLLQRKKGEGNNG